MFEKPLSLSEGNKCLQCARKCVIPEGGRGVCGTVVNREGKLYTVVYGRLVAKDVDPIEKKPLFHFFPGTYCMSIATAGCNFKCAFCQNWHISQVLPESVEAIPETPEGLVRETIELGLPGIAYTYTEPTVFLEFAKDTGILARQEGLYNVWISNGYMSEESRKVLLDFVDAANIDLKGDERFYRELCGGVEMEVVLENIAWLWRHGIHVEVTTLIVPGWNDSEEFFRFVANFIKSISPDIPLHFSRFWPHYRMRTTPPTPIETVLKAREIAIEEGVRYVYTGNIGNVQGSENTYCPNCGALVIEREGIFLRKNKLEDGRCPECGTKIYVITKLDELRRRSD